MRTPRLATIPLLLLAATAAAQPPIPPLAGLPSTAVIVEEDIILPNGPGFPESGFCGLAWPSGLVFYTFNSNVTAQNQAFVLEAMNELQAVSGIRFVPMVTGALPHIEIRASTANSSAVGMQPVSQVINLVSFGTKFIICHELLHAAGFVHEQSRPDRDAFVQILWNNVSQTACGGSCDSQFEIRGCASTGGPYDFDSVMHYRQNSFANPGTLTILCQPPFAAFQTTIGQRQHLSIQDATALAARYGPPAPPQVFSTVQEFTPAGTGNARIRIFGSGFFAGSADGSGVLGSQAHFNWTQVPTEYVSPTEVVATVPDELLAVPGLFPVAVFNSSPAGGFSNAVDYFVAEGFRKVMLTEVSWGSVKGVEICNFDVVPRSIQGWKVRWQNPGQTAVDSFSPGAVTLQPGQIAVFLDQIFANVPELPPNVLRFSLGFPNTTTQAFSVALLDGNGAVIDEVRATNTAGTFVGPDLGGRWKGYARRGVITGTTGAVSLERVWGLDSQGGSDWTEQPERSFGLENRSSGPRGSDAPFGFTSDPPRLLINEIDDDPDFIEIVNAWTYPVNLSKFYLLVSANNGNVPAVLRPFPYADLPPGGMIVLGEAATAPIEIPLTAVYVNVAALGQNIPIDSEEYSIGLYGPEGALIDLVRTTASYHGVVHNGPRLPSAWDDFCGAAGRNANNGDGAIGRDPAAGDTNRGSDWRPMYRRSLGNPNVGTNLFAGPGGLGDRLDVRINDTRPGPGLALIVNAGAAMAGKRFTFLSSYGGHLNGQGPIMGLGFDAILNWANFQGLEPWNGTLDARGSYRFDVPVGSLPPYDADHIVFVTDPATGAILLRTRILEEDH